MKAAAVIGHIAVTLTNHTGFVRLSVATTAMDKSFDEFPLEQCTIWIGLERGQAWADETVESVEMQSSTFWNSCKLWKVWKQKPLETALFLTEQITIRGEFDLL